MRFLLAAAGCLGLSLFVVSAAVQGLMYLDHGVIIDLDAIALHGMVALDRCGPHFESVARVLECRAASAEALGLSGASDAGMLQGAAHWLAELWLGGCAAAAMILLLPAEDRPRRRPVGRDNLCPARRAREAADDGRPGAPGPLRVARRTF